MNVAGLAIDWIEAVAEAFDDPEARPAGFAEPHYPVSPTVTISRDEGLYVYHLPDDQLGQGSSLGNASAWAETKGNGDMLGLFSNAAGARVLGGLSVTYLLPFSDLTALGRPTPAGGSARHESLARAMPSAPGTIHLHPAYQQREFIIGDGLHILETFYVPRTGMDDPAVAHTVVALVNRTPHPIGITVIAAADLRGHTPMDIRADFDPDRGALVAHNMSRPDWVRVFGGAEPPKAFWATTDEESAYNPGHPLPDRVDGDGDLTGALQYDMLLLPKTRHKLRFTVAFSAMGRDDALSAFDGARHPNGALKQTIAHYRELLLTAVLEMPDPLLTQGVQWAKACLVRPVSRYPIGEGVTNDPGWSTHLVGRDTAWYVHGCDFVLPGVACRMLRVLAEHQREDGLIPEFIDGSDGRSEDWGFNINDDTPLFLMAVGHHMKATGHQECLSCLYEPARRAGELILRQRDGRGLVRCTADGTGARGICGWRNVLANDQISGVVTEVNAECYAALCALAHLAELAGQSEDASRYRESARELRRAINEHLLNAENGLYIRNIDLEGRVFTQVTADLVFPLICGVADPDTVQAISDRLSQPDFMTEAGLRVLPSENPRYDPSFESGCLGGVWPGVTWWYAMGCCHASPHIMARSLLRSYSHYVTDPKTYNTVPGQFSEWSDGETLVNRGMRLSPWEPPRYLWAAFEGMAGLVPGSDCMTLDPKIPSDWSWMRLHNLPYRGDRLSFFLARQHEGLCVYTCNSFGGGIAQQRYQEEFPHAAESLASGLTSTVFRREKEILICLGSTLSTPTFGPFLAHHAIAGGRRYEIRRLSVTDRDWQGLGTVGGSDLQRITAHVPARGYVLYRFFESD